MYGDLEIGIADGLAIEFGNTVYIVDSGIENSKIDFGVRSRINIASAQLREEYIRRKNSESIRKGYIDNGLSSRFGAEYADDWRNYKRQEFRKELSTNQGKSTNNERRISQENADSGRGRLKHSYKSNGIDIYDDEEIYLSTIDSEGNSLTIEQYEFFIESKVRDENGNLQVCYHGTEGEFYVFDKALRGSSTGARDAKLGFFFTNSKETAEEYSIYAQDNKLYNLRFKITDGDKEKLEYMRNINNVFQMTGSEDIEEYKRLLRKSENFETDVKEVYLNIKNPYVEDWEGKQYKKGKMLKTVETAILKGHDGIIIKNIDDSVDYTGAKDNTYIVFDSNQIKLTTNKKPTLKDDIRYSHKESFAKQVDNVLSGQDKINSHLLVLENTPKLLQNIGLPDKPMLITAAHTKTAVGVLVKNKNVHNLNVETFKDLPSLIEKPAIIMDSSDESKNSIVLFVNAKDINGNPVVCSIRVEGEARYNNIKIIGNIVTSVYGKDANPTKFIEKAVKEDRILYWDKKMSQDLFDNPGLQLPDNIFNLDSDIIIRKTRAKVNTLDKNSSNVKFSHKQPAYVFSKGQINKKLAEHTRYKVYSKVETERAFNTILDNLYFDNYDIKITGKTKAEAIDRLWNGLNTIDEGKRGSFALRLADYILDSAVMENIFAEEEMQIYADTVSVLKPYLHNIELKSIMQKHSAFLIVKVIIAIKPAPKIKRQ